MSATITFTVQQRLNVEGIIRQQRSPDDETLMTNFELLKKVRIPQEEKPMYLREVNTPQGVATEFFTKSIKAAMTLDVDLEAAELRRLDALLKEWKNYTTDDVEWLSELKSQIAAVNNGTAAPSKKKLKEAAAN